MDPHLNTRDLAKAHTAGAIASRLNASTRHSYLGDFVLGAIDGAVTTFAIVAGAAGAGYSTTVGLVLGVANLVADGFSMAASNYLSTKSAREVVERVRRIEQQHIEQIPEGEREEVRQIFASKGFDGALLEQIVEVITDDRHRWIDTMVTEEFGLPLETPSPLRAGLSTFIAFALAGSVPLLPLFLFGPEEMTAAFRASGAATMLTFFFVGLAKGYVVDHSKILSGVETLAVGAVAASTAFAIGNWLDMIIG